MLAIINTAGWNAGQTGSSSTNQDHKTRSFNFMASLHSLATCAAGGTPTAVNPVDSSTSTKNVSFNCIKLLSNTEAGGWSVGASSNVTAASAFSASASTLYVDLYKDSGKSSQPWYRWSIGHEQYQYASGSFTSYPQLQMWCGHSNVNPGTTTISSDTYYSSDYGYNFLSGTTNWTSSPSQRPFYASSGQNITVAITANYIILLQENQMWYYGIRNQAGWELGRTDNPSWTTFGMMGDAGSAYHVLGNYQHTCWNYAYMAGITSSGTMTSASRRGSRKWYETGINAITGQKYNTTQNTQFNMNSEGGYLRPLFPMGYPTNNSSGYGWAPEAPVTDPVTGLTVPPAYPIVYNYGDGTYSCSGQIPGIYKGMSQDVTGLNFYVTASEYVIDGQSYIPVRSASQSYPELFFIRKA